MTKGETFYDHTGIGSCRRSVHVRVLAAHASRARTATSAGSQGCPRLSHRSVHSTY